MRIVAMGCSHMSHDFVKVPGGDILIHTGDMGNYGRLNEMETFVRWWERQPHKHKIMTAGNHDFFLESNRDWAKEHGFTMHEEIEVAGLKIFASPYTPQFGRWAFMGSPGVMEEIWEDIPDDLDILITHGPPRGILDRTVRGDHAGCAALWNRISSAKPKYHFFSHIHEGHGQWSSGVTRFINCSVLDENYDPVNPCVVINL